jgi:hypothetical protein
MMDWFGSGGLAVPGGGEGEGAGGGVSGRRGGGPGCEMILLRRSMRSRSFAWAASCSSGLMRRRAACWEELYSKQKANQSNAEDPRERENIAVRRVWSYLNLRNGSSDRELTPISIFSPSSLLTTMHKQRSESS